MEKTQKVFCIGLNKMGTTSIHKALQILGYKSVHYWYQQGNIKDIVRKNLAEGKRVFEGIEHFDAYSDWNHPSTNHLFKDIDEQYPNSKFILQTRELEPWLESRKKHLLRKKNTKARQKNNPNDPWLTIDFDVWTEEYHTQHREVKAHFETRPGDLLTFDVTKGDGWEKLCTFLGVDIPPEPFPQANTAKRFALHRRILDKLAVLIGLRKKRAIKREE